MLSFEENKQDTIYLWNKVFGDSEEEISFFIENSRHAESITFYHDHKIASMLCLVECTVDGVKGKYIYAACTDPLYQGRGYMSEIIDAAKEKTENYLCLIPANEGLIDFYKKRGFTKEADIDKIVFDEIPEIQEYLFDGYELRHPKALICEV